MANTTGPKIAVVDSIPDGATYGNDGRAFLRMYQALIQANVINMTTSAAPSTPANGDEYVVASAGSGAWVGKTNFIAYWSTDNPLAPSGEWEFYQPLKGWRVWNQADGFIYTYNGSTWVQQPIGVNSLNSGTSASASTFWRGDGTWAAAGGAAVSGGFVSYMASGTNTPTLGGSNAIVLAPFTIPYSITVSNLGWANGSNDNTNLWDFGIYNLSGTRQCHTGALHLLNSAGNSQNAALGSTTLAAGAYLYAVTHNAAGGLASPFFGSQANALVYYSTATTSSGGVLPASITVATSLTTGSALTPTILLY